MTSLFIFLGMHCFSKYASKELTKEHRLKPCQHDYSIEILFKDKNYVLDKDVNFNEVIIKYFSD